MITLGIETSCDDTSVCLLKTDNEKGNLPEVLAHQSFSQETILQEWGGVVPEIAARNHLAKITPLLKQVFNQAGMKASEVDQIGVTTHPGLLGPLLTGVNAAKSLSLINKTPINPVNHLFAHLEAIQLSEAVSYPYLGLLFSGGHSLFCLVSSSTEFKVIASTKDDAAGEAFDKGARVIGLGYPGGPAIEKCAIKGNPDSIEFPRPLAKSNKIEFSFSGLKTSLLYFMDSFEGSRKYSISDVAASYQNAIIDCLVSKLQLAAKKTGINIITIAGGVAKNSVLRNQLKEVFPQNNIIFPDLNYCTDNAAMISYLGEKKFNLGCKSNINFGIKPNFEL